MTGQFHISIGLKSLEASKKFYRDLLSAEIT